MIPPKPDRSLLTLEEWKAAFRPRKCVHCRTKFAPADRTKIPSNAAKMQFCSRACNAAAGRAKMSPARKAATAKVSAARFSRWYGVPENKSAHIARNSK